MFNENGSFCTSLAPNAQGSMLDYAAHASIYRDLDENNIVTSFSMDDLSNNRNHDPLPGEAASMAEFESLDQQIDTNGHIYSTKQNHHHLFDDYNGMQYQNVPYANTQFAVPPDLLNLMQLAPPPQGPSNYSLDMCNEIPGIPIGETGLNGLGYNANQSNLLRDLFHSLPKNGIFSSEDERDHAMMGIGGEIFQEMNDMQFENAILERKRELGRGRGSKGNFATERQRREQLNEKYKALKSLFPNPTKSDRASIVGDAIEYINELNRTIKELRNLLDKKKHRKRAKIEEDSGADMETTALGPAIVDQDHNINGTLRSSWLQRRSKESMVDVRIVDEEVNIRVTQKKRVNSLLYASKALDELQLDLMHVSGGNIGDHHIFMFNTKINEGASVYASAVAKKLLEAMDRLQLESLNNHQLGF